MNSEETWLDIVSQNNAPKVQEYFKTNSRSINDILENGHTPLTFAIKLQYKKVVQKLLQLGASACKPHEVTKENPWNPALTTKIPVFPLEVACIVDWPYAVIELLKRNANPLNHRGGLGSLLTKAVEWDNLEIVNMLFKWNQVETECGTPSSELTRGLLTLAVQKGHRSMVEHLIKKGLDVNVLTRDDLLPLMAAAQKEDISMCFLLIEQGADLGLTRKSSLRPNALAMSVRAGLVPAVNTLIAVGAGLDCRLSISNCYYEKDILCSGSTVLHLAVAKRHRGLIQILVEAGANVDAKDNEGNTPIHVACKDPQGDIAILNYLLATAFYFDQRFKKNGQDWRTTKRFSTVNSRNLAGLSALAMCCEQGRVDMVECLVRYGVNEREMETALHHAVRGGHGSLAEHLLKVGVDVNARCHNQLTSLHIAAMYSNVGMVQLLLEHGADLTLTNRNNESPLYLAVQEGCLDLVEMLIAEGCDVNTCTITGETCLMQAACKDQPEICLELIRQGALLDLQNTRQRETALSMATYFGCTQSAAVLISQGADLDKGDKRKTTPVYWCIYNGREEILRLLVLAGVQFSIKDLNAYPRHLTLMRNSEMITWLHETIGSPSSLMHHCRALVRRVLRHRSHSHGIGKSVEALPLPRKIRDYLLFRHEMAAMISTEHVEGSDTCDENLCLSSFE